MLHRAVSFLPSALVAAALFVPAPTRASAFDWPPGPSGVMARAFFAMLADDSDQTIQAFEAAHRGGATPAATAMEERIRRARELRQRFGAAQPERVVRASDSVLVIAARAADGRNLQFEFNLEPGDPGRIASIGIALGGLREVGPPRALTAPARAALVEAVAKAVEDRYVFPEVGRRMAQTVRGHFKSGSYGEITDELAIARRLTDDLRSVQNDGHLTVLLDPQRADREGAAARDFPGQVDPKTDNYGFRRVEWLEGNVGYLKLDLFASQPEARATADAAMAFLANADAMIIDLRDNGGGSPEMIRHLTSYFFPERTHLNSMLDRDSRVIQDFWTGEIPGKKFAKDLPLFVLTSSYSFSGAEEFAYNLKALKRATLLGETTGGGAHPVDFIRIDERFVIGVPFLRARNPITGTNWEGVGVEPDVKVPADKALDEARRLAEKAIAGG